MSKFLGFLLWGGVAILAAISLGAIAIFRGEHIDSIWLVLAAVCTYALGFPARRTGFLIMVILLAVVALVVVNALKGSPWATFTIAATMPIAVFMGLYLRYWRPGKVLEVSVIGFLLVLASIFLGQSVSHS